MKHRQMHLGTETQQGCKTSSKHLGAYIYTDLASFKALPESHQCKKCLNGKVFKLWNKADEAAAR